MTKNHKVIFAGNPLTYGGDRNFPRLFQRHGGAVEFKKMPAPYLYHEILTSTWKSVIKKPELSDSVEQKIEIDQQSEIDQQELSIIFFRGLSTGLLFIKKAGYDDTS